jgi:lysophospholipid acyltransferase (LPLAT)-like uncharacterized protein
VPTNPARVNAARQAAASWATSAGLNPPPARLVHSIPLWRRIAVWPLAAAVHLWCKTVRSTISDREQALIRSLDEPVIFVIWHNRLFLSVDLIRRYRGARPFYPLVSASRDGAWLEAFFSARGIRAVRGSSSRLGREAASGLVEQLRLGHDAGITPDGPRGPVYGMKPGALIVARRSHAKMLLVGMDFESSARLPTWDGFHLPRPFSTVHLRVLLVIADEKEGRDESARRLEALMREINPDRKPAPVRKSA